MPGLPTTSDATADLVLSVSDFLSAVNTALVTAIFPEGVWIEGEVVEYRVSQDKWIWFLLKDKDAVVPCFATTWQLRTPLEDGMQIRAFGIPKVHLKSGKFSFVVERVNPVGEGALRRAFELLKKQLLEQGLFALERKRQLPRFPQRIGLIASTESAAYSDFLRILGTRWGGVDVQVAHVQVQGRDAISSIQGAFRYFNSHPELADVVVLTRGGGSLEDLQAFNSEEVVRAVFGSVIPVVVGVGHERDETLADYAADVRASTPTNAAELVVPDMHEVSRFIEVRANTMTQHILGRLAAMTSGVNAAVSRLEMHVREQQAQLIHRLQDFQHAAATFFVQLQHRRVDIENATTQILQSLTHKLGRYSTTLANHERLLVSLDPRRLLRRGYSLVWQKGHVVKASSQVDIGAPLTIQFGTGTVDATVTANIGSPAQRTLL